MTTDTSSLPNWLPLLVKPYENMLGSRTTWDLSAPDGAPVRIERGSQGLNNALYRVRVAGQVYACKLFLVDERRRVEREWVALRACHAAGLGLTPEPVAYAPEAPLPQPVVVSTWIEGATLAGQALALAELKALIADVASIHRVSPVAGLDFLPAWHQPAGYAAYVEEARGFLRQVQGWCAKTGAGQDLPSWAADLPDLLPLLERAMQQAERLVAEAGDSGACPQPALIRIDGNPDNIIRRTDGGLAFIDWEYSGWGDPAFDLAELRWHPRSLHIAQSDWEAALADYPAPQGDGNFPQRLAIYSQLLPTWWVMRSAQHLLEGVGQTKSRQRLVRVPARFFRAARTQLDNYLAALGLIERPEEDERDGED